MRVTRALNPRTDHTPPGRMPETITDRIRRFFHRDRHTNQRTYDEAIHLLTDPFGEDGEEAADRRGVVTLEGIRAACRRMQGAGTKRDLLQIIAGEVSKFDLHDLETIYARFERRVDSLPAEATATACSQASGTRSWLTTASSSSPATAAAKTGWMNRRAPCLTRLHGEGAGEGRRPPPPELPPLRVHHVCHGRARPPHRTDRRRVGDDLSLPFLPGSPSTEPTFPETRARRLESLANYWTSYKG